MKNLMEMVSDGKFVQEVYEVIKYTMDDCNGDNVTLHGVEAMLKEWAKNKQALYELLGKNLKITETYLADAQYGDFKDDFQNFRDGLWYGFETKKDGKIELDVFAMSYDKGKKMRDVFDWNNPITTMINYICSDKNFDSVVNNVVDGNSRDVEVICTMLEMKRNPNGKKLTRWMREVLLATLEKLYECNAIDEDGKKRGLYEIDVICQYYSRLVEKIKNTTKSEHTVVLSIDPRDFYRCSHGTDWDSCHQIGNMHGDGAIQYCINSTTLIAYEEKIDHQKVAPLRWRQIVYTNKYFSRFVGSRQYKIMHNGNTEKIREMIMDCMEKYADVCADDWSLVSHATHGNAAQQTVAKYVKTGYHSYAYNDIALYGGLDKAVWMLEVCEEADNIIVNSEDEIVCLDCGEKFEGHRDYFYMCENCGGGVWCECCESYHDEDDMTYIEDEGRYICQDCLEENYEWCEHCERYVYNENCTYVECQNGYVCNDCLCNHYTYCEHCEEYKPYEEVECVKNSDGHEWFICDDCSDICCSYCPCCDEKFYTYNGDKECPYCETNIDEYNEDCE